MKNYFGGILIKLIFLLVILGSSVGIEAKEVRYLTKDAVCKAASEERAILRSDSLFIDDFLCVHSLVDRFKPQTFFEIGTCSGEGTQIIKNAMPSGKVYSLDLPLGSAPYFLQEVGFVCKLPYIQLFGDSLSFDYSQYYPIVGWFIDGAHDYEHVFHETQEAVKAGSSLIIWHDADIPEVFQAIQDALEGLEEYTLYRILSTRVAFSLSQSHYMEGL